VKIQGESQVLGLPASDCDGRRLGRIVAVDCAPQDSYTAVWFVLRLRGWRRGLRAVPSILAAPAASASLHLPAGLGAGVRDTGRMPGRAQSLAAASDAAEHVRVLAGTAAGCTLRAVPR